MKIENIKKVVTHPGCFHADDVLSVVLLQELGFEGLIERHDPTEAELKDPEVLVMDVGGQLDTDLTNFDHHQEGVPHAACMLIAEHFYKPECDAVVYRLLVRDFIKPISESDCGRGNGGDLSLSKAIALMNPATENDLVRDSFFRQAVNVMTTLWAGALRSTEQKLAGRDNVLKAPTCCNGQVLLLEDFAQWKEWIFDREDQANLLYVIFPSLRGGYCVQQVPEEPDSFEGRRPLPADWKGLRGKALAEYTKLTPGPEHFCHPDAFVGGAVNKEEAVAMAALALI